MSDVATIRSAPVKPGEALYSFLQEEWSRLGITRGAWCRQADLPDSTVHRWSKGHEPDIKSLRLVARKLGRPLNDILLAAKLVSPEELSTGISEIQITVYDGIRQDPQLAADPELQDAVRNAVRQLIEWRNNPRRPARKRVTIESRR